MIISSNQKLCIILSNNNTGATALCLISLRHTKEIVLFNSHRIVDGYQRRHCFFCNRRNIRYRRYRCGTLSIRSCLCFRYLRCCGAFCFCWCRSCYIRKTCKTGSYIIYSCHHTACNCSKEDGSCCDTSGFSDPAVFAFWRLRCFTVLITIFISVSFFSAWRLLSAFLPLGLSLRSRFFRECPLFRSSAGCIFFRSMIFWATGAVWCSPVYILSIIWRLLPAFTFMFIYIIHDLCSFIYLVFSIFFVHTKTLLSGASI